MHAIGISGLRESAACEFANRLAKRLFLALSDLLSGKKHIICNV